MNNLIKKIGLFLLGPLIVWVFLPGFLELWKTYTSFWLYENTLAAGLIVVLYAVAMWKYGVLKRNNDEQFPGFLISIGIFGTCVVLLLNNYLGGFQVLPPVLVYLAIYFFFGFFLAPFFWKKSVFVFLLLILTLPILERVQKFVGFPLRLMTANIVSFLLQFVGVGNMSNSTVIMTENYATTIDLPCSGVKSIYFGGVTLLAVYFLQQIKISVKSILLVVAFFALLVFFNIWRVFGLVYVYGVLHMTAAGDSIHVLLGIVGFVASCVFLWYGSEYVRKKDGGGKKRDVSVKKGAQFTREKTAFVCAMVLLLTGALTHTVIKAPDKNIVVPEQSVKFFLPDSTLVNIPFSEKEKTLFVNSDVTFASKYALVWQQKNSQPKNLSLLLVKSRSARTHHDPELCLQGLGYHKHLLPYQKSEHQLEPRNNHHGKLAENVFEHWCTA